MSDLSAVEYFDLGALQSWNFMDWSKGEVNVEGLNTYLDTFASQMQEQNLSKVIISFGQVSDISKMIAGEYSTMSTSDSLYMLDKNVGGSLIDGKSVFEYMVNRLVDDGIDVGLAFGGISAQQTDWTFDFSSSTPQELASNLASWAKSMHISQLDFDVELTTICTQNNPSQLAEFFTSLNTSMGEDPVTLTVMGDTNYWGPDGTVFKSLFEVGKLNDMFDGFNLMLYNGQYYLNAGQTPQEGWDLELWVSQISQAGKISLEEAAKFINVGFNAKLDYTSSSTSAGPLPYSNMPEGISSGSAAKFIYNSLIADLKTYTSDTSLEVGNPFFWDSNADYTVSANNNYESQFFSKTNNFEKDFTTYQLCEKFPIEHEVNESSFGITPVLLFGALLVKKKFFS